MNLAQAFAESARVHAARPAVFWGERVYAFSEIADLTTRLAGHLQSVHRVQPGNRVGLWLKNCPEFVPSVLAILSCGAVVVPINNFLKPDEVGYILNDAGIDLLITDHHMPNMNGMQLVRSVRDLPFHGKILIFCSELSPIVNHAYRQLDVDRILFKPVFPSELRRALVELYTADVSRR